MTKARVVLLAGGSVSSRIVASAVNERFDVAAIFVERPISRASLIKRRAARLGWNVVADQLVFQSVISPLLSYGAKKRIAAIVRENGWEGASMPESKVTHLETINDAAVEEGLRALRPDVIVVNGTRIVSKKVLGSTEAPFVNMHAGITPRYRGVHGGYWALAEQRVDLCGVTVHLVDPGIDTGSILAQATIQPTDEDDFATYPFLQLAAGLPLLLDAVERLGRGDRRTIAPRSTESALRYHPRASEYLWSRWKLGVR